MALVVTINRKQSIKNSLVASTLAVTVYVVDNASEVQCEETKLQKNE